MTIYIPYLTILPHSTNITLSEFVACIIESYQQEFAVDGTSTQEPTSYVISTWPCSQVLPSPQQQRKEKQICQGEERAWK